LGLEVELSELKGLASNLTIEVAPCAKQLSPPGDETTAVQLQKACATIQKRLPGAETQQAATHSSVHQDEIELMMPGGGGGGG